MQSFNGLLVLMYLIGSTLCMVDDMGYSSGITASRIKKWANEIKVKLVDELTAKLIPSEYVKQEFEKYAKVEHWEPEEVLKLFKERLNEDLLKKSRAVKELMANGMASLKEFYYENKINNNSCFHNINDEDSKVKGYFSELNNNDSPCFVRYMQTTRDNGDNSAWVVLKDGDGTSSLIEATMNLTYQTEENSNYNGRKVWLDGSGIHVPVSNHERRLSLLEAINSTERWFDIFTQQNRKLIDNDISYQFFCSAAGFMRYNPAELWATSDEEVDQYDCRLEPWYVSAVNSPRQVLILLDTSGSMEGQRDRVAEMTIRRILSTLTVRDYFNILTFSSKPRYASQCFSDGFIQASAKNKQFMMNEIREPCIQGESNFANLFTEAFAVFANSTAKGKSVCNEAMFLVTDGAAETLEELFQELNPDKRIRIFAYLIGKEITDFRETMKIACDNKGFFVHISSLDDVQEQLHHYVEVLSRPLAHSYAERFNATNNWHDVDLISPTWSELHQSHLGNTFSISVSLPVILVDELGDPKETRVLGVVGSHLPIQRLQQTAPIYELGGFSYSFLVDGDAHVIFHPQMRSVVNKRIKPNFNSLDILEVENDIENLEFREGIVNPPSNVVSFTGSSKKAYYMKRSGYLKRIFDEDLRYYITDVKEPNSENILYTLGLGVPNGKTRRITAKDDFGYSGAPKCLDGKHWRLNKNWYYCRRQAKEIRMEDAFLKDSIDAQDLGHLTDDCKKYDSLIRNTMMNAKATCHLEDKWKALEEDDLLHTAYILTAFGVTHAGFTRFFDFCSLYLKHCPDVSSSYSSMSNGTIVSINTTKIGNFVRFTDRYTNSIEEDFYQRAIRTPNLYIFNLDKKRKIKKQWTMTDAWDNDNSTDPGGIFIDVWGDKVNDSVLVEVTRAVFMNDEEDTPAAVLGFEMVSNGFMHIINDAIGGIKSLGPEETVYVTDENGFIIFTSVFNYTTNWGANEPKVRPILGKSIAAVEPCFVAEFIRKDIGIFHQLPYKNYQRFCSEVGSYMSNGIGRLSRSLITGIIGLIRWMIQELMMIFAEYGLLGTLTSQMAYCAGDQCKLDAKILEKGPPEIKITSCSKESFYYKFNPASKSLGKVLHLRPFTCSDDTDTVVCERQFIVQPVDTTNLIVILISKAADCNSTNCRNERSEIEKCSLLPEAETKVTSLSGLKEDIDDSKSAPADKDPNWILECQKAPMFTSRRSNETCFYHHKNDESTVCSGVAKQQEPTATSFFYWLNILAVIIATFLF